MLETSNQLVSLTLLLTLTIAVHNGKSSRSRGVSSRLVLRLRDNRILEPGHDFLLFCRDVAFVRVTKGRLPGGTHAFGNLPAQIRVVQPEAKKVATSCRSSGGLVIVSIFVCAACVQHSPVVDEDQITRLRVKQDDVPLSNGGNDAEGFGLDGCELGDLLNTRRAACFHGGVRPKATRIEAEEELVVLKGQKRSQRVASLAVGPESDILRSVDCCIKKKS